MRGHWVRVHRCAGLALTLFLFTAGLTGSIIAFHPELDAWLNPDWFETGHAHPPLPVQQLVDRLQAADHRLRVVYVPLDTEPGRAARVQVEARTASPDGDQASLGFNEMFVDPSNAAVLGRRQWGSCCLGRRQFVPFLYVLHHSLHLPGESGRLLMGTVALVWVFDCVVGLYLTFPRPGNRSLAAAAPSSAEQRVSQPHDRRRIATDWLLRWRKAWTIKRGAAGTRINWDLHRALGLWFWVLLIGMAVSGVSLNLQDEVFEPVVSWFFSVTPSPFDEREAILAGDAREPGISFADAIDAAGAEAHRRGWQDTPNGTFYNASFAIYGVHFGAENGLGLGPAYVYIDAADGSVLGTHRPGEGSFGDLVADIQFPLHSGRIAGLPGRLAIAATGIAVAVLSITGVVIWLAKRRVRSAQTPAPNGAGR
ncbi:MAG: PepSY-associated TM helix domain-containing protein [Pseudomonadota bacterium]